MPIRKYYQANKEHWRAYNREYLRKWRLAHPKRKTYSEHDKRYRETPEERPKYMARQKVKNALRIGKIVRGDCETGVDCYGRIQAHHPDYSKPLEVKWLCFKHHRAEHGIFIGINIK